MLNNQSFNLMKALEEAEQMEIKKKVIVDSYHEELIESVDLTEGCNDKVEESTEETQEVSKEERLASLKTQLETDGDQLAPDEKAAIQEEINKLEAELNECDTKPMNEEEKVEENVEINVDSETGDVEVTTDEGENVEVVDETEEPDESTDEEVTDEEPSEEAPLEVTDEIVVDDELKEESQEIVTEQEVSNLREVKNQGNIFMLQDDTQFIVGENYNESEALIENAEIYTNKDDADKDYLGRCEITKDGEPAKIEESEETKVEE